MILALQTFLSGNWIRKKKMESGALELDTFSLKYSAHGKGRIAQCYF